MFSVPLATDEILNIQYSIINTQFFLAIEQWKLIVKPKVYGIAIPMGQVSIEHYVRMFVLKTDFLYIVVLSGINKNIF